MGQRAVAHLQERCRDALFGAGSLPILDQHYALVLAGRPPPRVWDGVTGADGARTIAVVGAGADWPPAGADPGQRGHPERAAECARRAAARRGLAPARLERD